MSIEDNGIKKTAASEYALSAAKALGLTLTSGYRSPSENARVGGGKVSAHMTGTAYDFAGSRTKMLALADKLHKSGKFKQIIFQNKDYKTGRYIADHQDHVHVSWDANGAKADSGGGGGYTAPDDGIVKEGNSGSIVAAIQKLLGSINIDGFFGDATDKAVKDFQAKHNLTTDGIVGSKTWEKLTGGGSIFFSR